MNVRDSGEESEWDCKAGMLAALIQETDFRETSGKRRKRFARAASSFLIAVVSY